MADSEASEKSPLLRPAPSIVPTSPVGAFTRLVQVILIGLLLCAIIVRSHIARRSGYKALRVSDFSVTGEVERTGVDDDSRGSTDGYSEYGRYAFLVNEANFPTYKDPQGYIYRVLPFRNIVRNPRRPKLEQPIVIGEFQGMHIDGNIILGNGTFCNKIMAPRSGSLVAKCGPKALTMKETSSCVYLFTMFHPRLCFPEPTNKPTEIPTIESTFEPTYIVNIAESFSPTLKPVAAPTLEPTTIETDDYHDNGGRLQGNYNYGKYEYLSGLDVLTAEDADGYLYHLNPFRDIVRFSTTSSEAVVAKESLVDLQAHMFGGNIVGSIPVVAIRKMNGEHVFLAQDGNFVRMVTDGGISRYYEGTVDNFDPKQWGYYISAQKSYHVNVPPSLTSPIPEYYLMYGTGISREMLVEKIFQFNNCTLYFVQDGAVTKIVSSVGDAKMYNGLISGFSVSEWNNYEDVGMTLLVKRIVTSIADLGASPHKTRIGVFEGLDQNGNIFVTNGDTCSASGGAYIAEVNVLCGSTVDHNLDPMKFAVLTVEKTGACSYSFSVFTLHACSAVPSFVPSSAPSPMPTVSLKPTRLPLTLPTYSPFVAPSFEPSKSPIPAPTLSPTPQTTNPDGNPCDIVSGSSTSSTIGGVPDGPTLNGVPVDSTISKVSNLVLVY